MHQRGRGGGGRGRGNFRGRRGPLPPEPEDIKDGKKFSNLYYAAVDQRRAKIAYMYAENCRLLFNGNPYVGFAAINDFWTTKMPETVHTVTNVAFSSIPAMKMMSVTCSGSVEMDSEVYFFDQSFNCVLEDDIWKILTDNLRHFR